MRLNLVLWQVAKTFYSLSLFVMVPFFAFVWIGGLNDKDFPATAAQIYSWGILTFLYVALGWFLLSYTPKQYYKSAVNKVSSYKKNGFDASTFEMYSKLYNRYVGWNIQTNQFLFISLDENFEQLATYEDILDLYIQGQYLVLITDFKTYPKIHIQITPVQRNFVEAALAKKGRRSAHA